MKILSDMPISQALALYYDKHQALKEGNLLRLLGIKKICPDLFDASVDAEMRDMIAAIEIFRASGRYKDLCKQHLKERLSVVSNNTGEC